MIGSSKIAAMLRRPWRDRAMLGAAAVALGGFAIAVRVVSLRRILRAVQWVAPVSSPQGGEGAAAARDRVIWAVRAAAPYVPGAACLPQALAARLLLGWSGQACRVRIGVAKNAQDRLEAHAWVVRGDEVLIGGFPGLDRYAPLPELDPPE